MKNVKYLGHPALVAILAGFMQFLDMKIGLFCAWAGFAAWACYFLAGCNPKGGAKVIGCWIGGVVGAIAIIELGTRLSGSMPATVGFPIAVAIIAFFVICFEKVPALDMIPAWFVGAACFFGYNTIVEGKYGISAPTILISCVVGQIFGFVTVLLRTKYAEIVEGAGQQEEAAPQPAEQ